MNGAPVKIPDSNDLLKLGRLPVDPLTGAKPIAPRNGSAHEPPDDDDPSLIDHPGEASDQPVELATLGSILEAALARAERRRLQDERPVPVLGEDYAKAIGRGRWPGAHIVLSGTGAGKSQYEIQNGILAAKAGVPVVYIGLELSELQIALRAIGEETRLPWSSFYIGEVSKTQMERARAAIPLLAGLPFHVEFGKANGWPISRLDAVLRAARAKYPSGPLSVVLDFLQLVAPADRMGHSDIRQHIGDSSYRIHEVAMRYDAAISVISSSARNHYSTLSGDIADAGFSVARPDPLKPPIKRIASPERFVGMSKESGSTEFAAESVTALVRWPGRLVTGETIVVAVAAKVRCRWPSWAAYTFEHGRFDPYHVTCMEDLPEIKSRKKGAAVEPSTLEKRILDAVNTNPNLRSASAIAGVTTGTKADILRVVKAMLAEGRLAHGSTGIEAASLEPSAPDPHHPDGGDDADPL